MELLKLAKAFVDSVNARPREWAEIVATTPTQIVVDCGRRKLDGREERSIHTRVFRSSSSGRITHVDYYNA